MQKVRIKKIEIINFKGVEHLELDFTYPNSDRILDNVVFYGINGSGKSTILEAINISIVVISISPTENISLKKLEEYLIKKISLGKEWIYNNKEEFQISIQIVEENNLITSTLIYNKNSGLIFKIENLGEKSKRFQNFPMEYLSSYRLFYPTKVNKAGDWSKIKELKNNLFSVIENHSLGLQFANDYNSVKQYLVNLITDKKVGVINNENLKVLEKIKEAFDIFFPNKIFLEQLARSDMNQDYKFLIQNEDGTVVDIDQLSSGEREVIAFFTFLCTKAMNVSILIIDEPELHLHDKWQSILLYAIHKLFPNIQLFLATHSETIHQSLSESELFEIIK
jgi:predicted ATP-binding protein involved in virulence